MEAKQRNAEREVEQADEAIRSAESLIVDGRRYVRIRVAADAFYYSQLYVYALVKQGRLRKVVRRWRTYVCLSDLAAYDAAQRHAVTETKQARLAAWWQSHPGEYGKITTVGSFVARLAQDGI